MSLLHKNGILKEYRRQHREELAAQASAAAAVERGDTDGAHAGDADDDDEFPDVAAFQVVGASSSAAPSHVSAAQASTMTRMGETGPTSTPAGSAAGGRAGGKQGLSKEPLAFAAPSPPPAAARPPHPKSPYDEVSEEDEFAEASGDAKPLPMSLVPPPLQDSRSRSDVTVEDERGGGNGRQHSLWTDPTVSPTTLTVGADTFANATDAVDGVSGMQGPSARAVHGGQPVLVTHMSSVSNAISSTSGLPLSPASSKPHSPTTLLAPPLSVPMGQLTPAQVAPGNRSVAEAKGDAGLDVSSSSASSGAGDSPRPDGGHGSHAPHGPRGTHHEHASMMSEEVISRLNLHNTVTTNSFEGETMLTGGSPGVLRADISDTMLQPPTSILSELSTLDATTATLASLRQRSNTLRALERASKAGRGASAAQVLALTHEKGLRGSGGDGRPLQQQQQQRHEDDEDDDVFSRLSTTEVLEGTSGSPNLAPPLVDAPIPVGHTNLLSFSGTARTLPRIGEDEDVDVDPSSVFTDPRSRSPQPMKPITFYEAYMELIKDMPSRAAPAHKSSSAAARDAPPSQLPREETTKKKSGLASLFGCCAPDEADVQTRQPPTYAQPSADLDRVGAESARTNGAAAAADTAVDQVEEDLRVVHFLKSTALSLQSSTHRRILYTVFNVLTGQVPWPHLHDGAGSSSGGSQALTPPSSTRSVRWEAIGFQGSNPATDVRATGILGVLQLLYLLDYYPSFTQRLWNLCQNPAGVRAASQQRAVEPPRQHPGIANELPFVLVSFNFTALVLDAVGQHLLDVEIRRARRSHLTAVVVPVARANKPEAHLGAAPGMYVCCEALVGALELFAEAWWRRLHGGDAQQAASPLPPLHRPSIALFGEVKAQLRSQVLKKGGAVLLHDAVGKVRAEAMLTLTDWREKPR